MARTDACAVQGFEAAVERAQRFAETSQLFNCQAAAAGAGVRCAQAVCSS